MPAKGKYLLIMIMILSEFNNCIHLLHSLIYMQYIYLFIVMDAHKYLFVVNRNIQADSMPLSRKNAFELSRNQILIVTKRNPEIHIASNKLFRSF